MKSKIVLFLALLFSPLYFFGWGKEGHHIVADIAQKKLKKGVEEKVQKYLGSMTFEQAAVWMDEIKSDHSLDFMKQWHYLNIEKDSSYAPAKGGDVVSELNKVITELKNYRQMKDEDVQLDLKILFHLCGDVTQPLHTGYGIDKGGNDIKVTCNTKQTNLHHIWDSDMIISEKISADDCMKAAKHWKRKERKSYLQIDPLQWAKDSRKLLPEVYDFKDNTIPQSYINANKINIENQLAKGGYRLAAVLNSVFAD
jgi:hypothetical protein